MDFVRDKMIRTKCSVGWWPHACYLRSADLMHLYLIHFQKCTFFVGGMERGGMTEGYWRTDGREYLRTEPNRPRFLCFLTH